MFDNFVIFAVRTPSPTPFYFTPNILLLIPEIYYQDSLATLLFDAIHSIQYIWQKTIFKNYFFYFWDK